MPRLFLLTLFALLAFALPARAAEVIPPSPAPRYIADPSHILKPETADLLNTNLQAFERATSNQVFVAIYPKMQSDDDIAPYTYRIAQAWRVGQKSKNNGVVLFVFVQDKKDFIQVGSGLEGALPDATCKQIIEQRMRPQFAAKDYDAGVTLAVAGIVSAIKGEYQGTGQLPSEDLAHTIVRDLPCIIAALALFFLPALLLLILHLTGGTFYQQHVRSLTFAENFYLFLINIGLNIIFSAGSSSSSGGGGGSSGGGGSFSGGGAGGSW